MKSSMAVRALTIGFAVVAMVVAVGGTNSYAYTAKTKWVVAKVPQYAPEQNVKMRYYGGPKSPMYP